MKKLFLLIIPVIYIISFTNCKGSGKKTAEGSGDTSKVKQTGKTTDTTSLPEQKHLAFLDSALIVKMKKDKESFVHFFSQFQAIPKNKFTVYHNYFKTLFNIGTGATPAINNFKTMPFLIYDKFQGFQYYLGIQNPTKSDPAGTPITFENRIRIYPALNATTKIFYIVMMAEERDITTVPNPIPVTKRAVYYRIIDEDFDMIPLSEMTQADADIRNFQSTWAGMSDQANPGYVFDPVYSYTYSIAEYNELLSNVTPYWNWTGFQTSPGAPKRLVRVHPIAIADATTSHVSFKLVFVPYTRDIFNIETRDDSRGFFNHMDVCPDKCPSNSIQ